AALIQLSHYESLSLVALEAWAQGTPVIADQRCAVLAGDLGESGAGQSISGFDAFAAALDDLWAQPERWRAMGQRGQEYVRTHYASRDKFRQTLEEALRGLRVPISEHMRRQGLLRAAEHDRSLWRERFGRLIEDLLDAPSLPKRERVEVQPRIMGRTAPAGQGSVLMPVRVANRGTHPAMHEGPARMMLRAVVMDEAGQPCPFRRQDTPLPGLLLPGQEISAV